MRTISAAFSRSSSGRISPRKRFPGKARVIIWIGPIDSTERTSNPNGWSVSLIAGTIVAAARGEATGHGRRERLSWSR